MKEGDYCTLVHVNKRKPVTVEAFCCKQMKRASTNGNVRQDDEGYYWLADKHGTGKMIIHNCPFCGHDILYVNT